MRILSNFFGKFKTYGFDKRYNTKKFYQKIQIPTDNYTVKLVSMFNKNFEYDNSPELNMEEQEQYIRIDFGDDSIIKGLKTINSGKYNINDGEIITHTYSKAGTYIVTIESIEDLILIDESTEYQSIITRPDSPSSQIRLVTLGIGGMINCYIPPQYRELQSKLRDVSTEVNRLIDMPSPNSTNLIENLKLRSGKLNVSRSLFRSTWMCTVEKFTDMISPIDIRYDLFSKSYSPSYSIKDYSLLFTRWFKYTKIDLNEVIYENMDKTLYNLFKRRFEYVNLAGFMSHTKDMIKVTDGLNLSYILKLYTSDYVDFDNYEEDKYPFKIVNMDFVFWDTESSSDKYSLKTLNDDLRFIDKDFLYEFNKGMRFSFGLMPQNLSFEKAFRFSYLLPNTSIHDDTRLINSSEINFCGLFFNSKIKLAPDLNSRNFYTNKEFTKFRLDYSGMFMHCVNDPSEDKYKEDITEDTELSYVQIGDLNSLISQNVSTKIRLFSVLGFFKDSFANRIENFYNIKNNAKIKKISIVNTISKIDNIVKVDNKYSECILEFYYFLIGDKDLDLFTYVNNNKEYLYFFSSNDLTKLNENKTDVRFNLNLNFTLGTQSHTNRIVNMDTSRLKLYFDFDYTNDKIKEMHYIYSRLLFHANIDTINRNDYDFLMPSYLKFRHKYNTLRYDQVKNKCYFKIEINGICENSDYDTKEIVLKSLSVPNDLDKTELYNFPDDDNISMFSFLPMPLMPAPNDPNNHPDPEGSPFPVIYEGRCAFKNYREDIIEYSRLDFNKETHLFIRDRSKYPTNKKKYRNNVYGLHIPELFFYDKNFYSTDKGSLYNSFSEMFFDNIALSVDYYKEPLKYRFNPLNKDCTDMFGLSITLEEDILNNYKISEFNFRNDLFADIFIEYNAKHAFIFDHFRFIDPSILDTIKNWSVFYAADTYSSEDIDSIRNIQDFMKNRITHTYFLNHVAIYNDSSESYQCIVDNKLTEEVKIKPYINIKIDHNILYQIDKIMGIKYNLSKPNESYFSKYEKDLTRNYKFTVHYNTGNILDNNKECIVKMVPNICSIFNMENNSHEIKEWVQSNSLNGKNTRFKVVVNDKIDFYSYIIPSSFTNIESIDLSKVINIKDDIIESRVYVTNSYGTSVVDSFMPIVNFRYDDYILRQAYLTNLTTNDFEIPDKYNNESFYLLNELDLFYLTPSSLRFMIKNIDKGKMNNKKIIINGSALQNQIVPNSDMFDLLYHIKFMNDYSSNISISYGVIYPQKTEVIRDRDLKFLSYFENIDGIDFTNELKYIDGDGLLHNDYVEENLRLSKIRKIKNLFNNDPINRPKLIAITGSLVNITHIIDPHAYVDYNYEPQTRYDISISDCFSSSGANGHQDIITLKDFNSSFFDGISYINTHCKELHPLFIGNVMNSYYILNSRYRSSLLESNIISSAVLIGIGERFSKEYKRAKTLDDYDVNNLEIEVFTFNNNDLASIRLENVMITPVDVLGNRFTRINIRLSDDLKYTIEDPKNFASIEWKDFFAPMVKGPYIDKANSVDYFLFNPEIDFDYRTPTLLFESYATYIPKSMFKIHASLRNKYKHAKEWESEYSISYKELKDCDLSPEDSDDMYLIKVLFNYHSTKRIFIEDIERMIFEDLNVYQYTLIGFKINADCNIRMNLEIPARSNELKDGKIQSINNYQRDLFIKLDDNTYLEEMSIENIRNEEFEKMERMLEIDFKVRINKHFIPMNSELFRNKVFVKDNADNIFEMQQLRIRKNEGFVPSIENDPYWHINISNSELSRNVTLNESTKSRLYTGQIIFTKSFSKYDNIKDPLYLHSNTLTINVPIELDEIVLYCINDVPYSLYNSDGYVTEIYGECGFDLEPYFNKDPKDSNKYTLDIDSYLYEISNGYKIHYISPSHFNGFGTTMNSKRQFYLGFNEFFIEKFDLEIISKFGERCDSLINSFNSEEHKIDVYGYMRPRVEPFNISSCFNVNTNIVGFSTLFKPFNDIVLGTISYSFNLRESSLNRFIPEGFLNSNLADYYILQESFNKCIIGYKLRTTKLIKPNERYYHVDAAYCFDGSLYQELINQVGFYRTVLQIMNISYNSIPKKYTRPGYTKNDFVSALNALKQYISENTTNTTEGLSLDNSKINRKMLVNKEVN